MLKDIKSPNDIKKLNIDQLTLLCEEIRQELISTVSRNGGHLASNLGVVELTVALHYVFDVDDKIVWDVGHQSYVHKMLTGRYDEFSALRQKGGLSGFCDPDESASDQFVTGHASTSISEALGLATARDVRGENYNVIAVIGDGALTGGLSYEALNNIKDTKMLVVLNDNGMSIGSNVGSLSRKISKIRVGKYDKRKQKFKNFLLKIPLIGKPLYKTFRWFKRRLKWMILKNNYFETFDLKYVGVIDGNDLKDLIYYLSKIKNNVTKPTVLHVTTSKGKGYPPAEADSVKYHSITADSNGMSSSHAVGECLCQLAEENDIAAITAAMKDSVGLKYFSEKFPDRCFDVGIAEEHAVTFAAGLYKGGLKPYVLIYSTFLQRAYDQILHDVAISALPVTFLLDRAGFVGADGQTHQGLQDLSYLSNIPNITIWAPCCICQLQQMIYLSANFDSPLAIRYSKTLPEDGPYFIPGKWNVLTEGKVRLLAIGGTLVANCLAAAKKVGDTQVVAVTTVKPLDFEYLDSVKSGDVVITVEENQFNGGLGEAVAAYLSGKGATVVNIAVKDKFIKHATIEEQLEDCGMDVGSIEKILKKYL